MRQGQQHRRGRGRNNQNNNNNHSHNQHGQRKGQNPLTRSFESNGPDVKVRGTPAHVAEKYLQLARDAQSSGDHVLAENYLQHAEHYNRIIIAYREQQSQHSGDMANGNGSRQYPQRSDLGDGDDSMAGDGLGDDGVASEQPYGARNAALDPQRTMDAQPSLDDGRPQRNGDHHPRFRDRPSRHDRPEGYERPERQSERPERQSERPERQSERQSERGFDRPRERPPYQSRDVEQPSAEPRDQRESRELRQPREHREPREQRLQPPREPDGNRAEAQPVPVADGGPEVRAERPEGGPRRRERFGLGADQPDFLRRPVRRPRRDPEPGFVPETPPASDDPPRE